MSIRERLLKIEPMAASLSVYVPAVGLQRFLSLVRTIFFIWLMGQVEFGLWGLGCMVFGVGSTLVTLAGFNGIVRYVSHYQARGRLKKFYRAVAWKLTGLAAALTVVAVILSPWLADAAIGTSAGGSPIGHSQRVAIFNISMLNAFLMAGYLNMTSWMRGLRVYRLLSVADVLQGALFFALGWAALRFSPTAQSALMAHALSLGVVLVGGLVALQWAIGTLSETRVPGVASQQVPEIQSPLEDADILPGGAPAEPIMPDHKEPKHMLRRLLMFSVVSLAGVLLWQIQSYVSLWFVQRYHGEVGAGLYQAFFVLCQMIPVLASTVWAVVYSHVSVHWEHERRVLARSQLEVSYKTVVLGLTVLGVVLYLAVDQWSVILPPSFRVAKPLLPWLLMYFLGSSSLGYVYVASNLCERPSVSILTATVGVLFNLLLAHWLVQGGLPIDGAIAGAKAAGLASLTCLFAAAAYLLISRFGATWVALLVSFSPAVMLLPPLWAGLVMLAVAAAAVGTPWIFPSEQKRLLVHSTRRVLQSAGRLFGKETPP